MKTDTVFALASGRLPSGVAIVRVSGPAVRAGLMQIAGGAPPGRKMVLSCFVNGDGSVIDTGLVVFFPGPHSFTGEDCAEFHLHGGIAVVRAMLSRLAGMQGYRAAEAGEFTKRAFMSGKVDLTQAEGLADLISAETEAQRRLAISQSSGYLKDLYFDWRRRLLNARAMIEAAIDFSEEDDVATRAIATLSKDINLLRVEMRAHGAGYRSSEIIREGFQVVIVGAPNAGKSSLLNALAQRDVAIVSDEAGTTRDLIEVNLEVAGNLIVLTDTAGLREAQSVVEAIGVDRARSRLVSADLVLLVTNMDNAVDVTLDRCVAPVLRVGTHADIAALQPHDSDLVVSSVTGVGIEALKAEIGRCASSAVGSAGLIPSRERQVNLVLIALRCLDDVSVLGSHDLEIIAEFLRQATDSIGGLVGLVDVEDLLDVIFSQFCIGK